MENFTLKEIDDYDIKNFLEERGYVRSDENVKVVMQSLSSVSSNHAEDEWNLVCDVIDNIGEKLEKIEFITIPSKLITEDIGWSTSVTKKEQKLIRTLPGITFIHEIHQEYFAKK